MTVAVPLSQDERAAIRRSGLILAEALQQVCRALTRGVDDPAALDRLAEERIRSRGGTPSFKGYRGFPASLCVSVNDQVVHGLPSQSRRIQAGDCVGFDLGVRFRGMYTDAATTVAVGRATVAVDRLLSVTRQALAAGLAVVRGGIRTGDIGSAVQAVAEAAGFGVVRDLVGHGVGRAVHEDPSIPNFGQPKTGPVIPAGVAIAIEPMVTDGGYQVTTDPDGWTVRTLDGSRAAHEERTILVTEDGYELLTPIEP